MDRLGVTDVGAPFPHRVTYHPTCHSLRVTRVGDAPLRLLRAVAGLELVELPDAEQCCGFGGTFAIKNADTSIAMLADKCAAMLDTGAEVCTAVDSSCLLQIGGGLRASAPACAPCTSPRSSRAPTARVSDAIPSFPVAAREALADPQLRAQPRATRPHTIRDKRAAVVAELPDWEQLRDAGRAIKDRRAAPPRRATCSSSRRRSARAGGTVHWARDGAEANRIVAEVVRGHGVDEVVKVKSLTTDEIGLNDALAQRGIHAIETDLAELILQLDGDWSSHILVPAIHRNRTEIRDLFRRSPTRRPI